MLLNARKEVGFTVNLKAVKRNQLKVEEPNDSSDQTPEWSWKKGKDQQGQDITNSQDQTENVETITLEMED